MQRQYAGVRVGLEINAYRVGPLISVRFNPWTHLASLRDLLQWIEEDIEYAT